jgi:hypothetical protein
VLKYKVDYTSPASTLLKSGHVCVYLCVSLKKFFFKARLTHVRRCIRDPGRYYLMVLQNRGPFIPVLIGVTMIVTSCLSQDSALPLASSLIPADPHDVRGLILRLCRRAHSWGPALCPYPTWEPHVTHANTPTDLHRRSTLILRNIVLAGSHLEGPSK